jgi:hypothetical protein
MKSAWLKSAWHIAGETIAAKTSRLFAADFPFAEAGHNNQIGHDSNADGS